MAEIWRLWVPVLKGKWAKTHHLWLLLQSCFQFQERQIWKMMCNLLTVPDRMCMTALVYCPRQNVYDSASWPSQTECVWQCSLTIRDRMCMTVLIDPPRQNVYDNARWPSETERVWQCSLTLPDRMYMSACLLSQVCWAKRCIYKQLAVYHDTMHSTLG